MSSSKKNNKKIPCINGAYILAGGIGGEIDVTNEYVLFQAVKGAMKKNKAE